jgi:hypothetical protein
MGQFAIQLSSASIAISRQTRWPECGRAGSPVKAGLRPPPSAAKGLDRAACSAVVRHREFDGGFRLMSGTRLASALAEASYTDTPD